MSLKILHHNMQGGAGRLAGLEHLLLQHDVDVACLQETHFAPSLMRLGHYLVYSAPPCVGGHGVAILVRSSIRSRPLIVALAPDLGLEFAGVTIYLQSREVAVFSLYATPAVRSSADSWAMLSPLLYPYSVVCGDFYAHHHVWDSGARPDRRGRHVMAWMETNALVLLNDASPRGWGRPDNVIPPLTSLSLPPDSGYPQHGPVCRTLTAATTTPA